jgi:hypothetical protein
MEAAEAAKVLRASIDDPKKPLTIADAATKSGLALRDAERGLHALSSEYRGHLRVTSEGELLFLYPTGFTKPWETRSAVSRALSAIGRGATGVLRFAVRAWLLVVLVSYALLFLAVIIGLSVARSSSSSSSDRDGFPGSALLYVVFRVLADAIFWTFHPFSPVSLNWGERARGHDTANWRKGPVELPRADSSLLSATHAHAPADAPDAPFYEKVNRFFFGPTPQKPDPRAMERTLLTEIRSKKGRIGLADVMRVTGLPRAEADPLMARLMLDYDGDVFVSEDGGIAYRFESLRKTVDVGVPFEGPRAAWEQEKRVPPLTGNGIGTNFLIVLLNGFNVVMSLVAIGSGLTIERLSQLLSRVPIEEIAPPSTPWLLGIVPLVLSLALFLLPIGRAIGRAFEKRKVAQENGRLAVLREVVTRVEAKQRIDDAVLATAWRGAVGEEPSSKELTKRVVELGGTAEIEDAGTVRYRFVDLETEAKALEEEREAAAEAEADVGKVIFASDR